MEPQVPKLPDEPRYPFLDFDVHGARRYRPVEKAIKAYANAVAAERVAATLGNPFDESNRSVREAWLDVFGALIDMRSISRREGARLAIEEGAK